MSVIKFRITLRKQFVGLIALIFTLFTLVQIHIISIEPSCISHLSPFRTLALLVFSTFRPRVEL